MSEPDVAEPRTGHPDDRHRLGDLRGASVRGDVLELHGSDGSATVRVPHDLALALSAATRDMAESAERYGCRHCGWSGDECERRDHYPTCPGCGSIVDVREVEA